MWRVNALQPGFFPTDWNRKNFHHARTRSRDSGPHPDDIARAFHRNRDDVIVASRNDNGLIAEFSERVRFVACDVRGPDDLRAMRSAAGGVDVFINNAGYSECQPREKVDEAFWDNIMATNLKDYFSVVRQQRPRCRQVGSSSTFPKLPAGAEHRLTRCTASRNSA
nr:SDR family oxidoreductase [Mycobacterium riyadhense]